MANVVIEKDALEKVEFFGKSDMNSKGGRASEVPAWYLRQNKEELEQSIETAERQLRNEEIPQQNKPEHIAKLEKMKVKMDRINEETPNYSGASKDRVSKSTEDLGSKIAEAMFTRTEMMKGLADAHEEARRMSEPCIKLNEDQLILAKKAGCRIYDGKVNRTDAERVWKFCRRSLGESSNTEYLRKG